MLAAAGEKLDLLKKEEAEKAQVVQKRMRGLKEQQFAAEKRLSDFKNAPGVLVKSPISLSAAVAEFRK